MTTAHRPTWKAAVGKANEGGWTAGGAISTQRSALDAPAHTTLKLRAQPVNKKQALKESLLALEEAEKTSNAHNKKLPPRPLNPALEERAQQRLLTQTADVDIAQMKAKYNDSDIDDDGGGGDSSSEESDLDDSDSSDDDDNGNDSDSDDEDEEAALQAELAKIRAERQEAQEKKAAVEEEQALEESALLGNPLLATTSLGSATGQTKRRWNEDVVFRNQAKNEPKLKKRFINDTIRNDFHKRFLNKFIR